MLYINFIRVLALEWSISNGEFESYIKSSKLIQKFGSSRIVCAYLMIFIAIHRIAQIK